jgi:DNA replication protein DnaC
MPTEESVCPQCEGSGWRVIEKDGVSAAERCDCDSLTGSRARRLEENSGIPPLYQNASVDNFILPGNPIAHRELAAVLLTVKGFIREFPNEKKPGLLFVGETGTGKTHLAVAALRSLIGRGFEGLFFDYQNLLDRIRAGFDPASGASDREAYRVALDTEILLLDDLGAHRVLDWVEDTVTSIITYRCNHRKALIATTNLTDPDAVHGSNRRPAQTPGVVDHRITLEERIGSRARSRLFEMCTVVRMPLVEDHRLGRPQTV